MLISYDFLSFCSDFLLSRFLERIKRQEALKIAYLATAYNDDRNSWFIFFINRLFCDESQDFNAIN